MVDAGRTEPQRTDLTQIPKDAAQPVQKNQPLCWLDVEPLMQKLGQWKKGRTVDPFQIGDLDAAKETPSAEKGSEKAKQFDFSSYSLANTAEVVERLQHTYDGVLFPEKLDAALAKTCECLQKDMKKWSQKIQDGGDDKELLKEGAKLYLRLAALMRDPKLNRPGPADYDYSRALELAVASEDKCLIKTICQEYSQFLRASFPKDKGKLAKADSLDEIAKKQVE
jgi:hypothetical protein